MVGKLAAKFGGGHLVLLPSRTAERQHPLLAYRIKAAVPDEVENVPGAAARPHGTVQIAAGLAVQPLKLHQAACRQVRHGPLQPPPLRRDVQCGPSYR